jgi:hypothetical protein
MNTEHRMMKDGLDVCVLNEKFVTFFVGAAH